MIKEKSLGKAFSDVELSAFTAQLALILKSGLSSYEGISAMLEDAATAEEINILACLMKQGWVQRQVSSIENTRMKYSGSDFKMTS